MQKDTEFGHKESSPFNFRIISKELGYTTGPKEEKFNGSKETPQFYSDAGSGTPSCLQTYQSRSWKGSSRENLRDWTPHPAVPIIFFPATSRHKLAPFWLGFRIAGKRRLFGLLTKIPKAGIWVVENPHFNSIDLTLIPPASWHLELPPIKFIQARHLIYLSSGNDMNAVLVFNCN
ncbi:hypothetical protein K438DRAFT_1756773 [Mycena galopus ATCC 62051]|nr:hypothetical protein K438DRAFT_1756773 [Mycena galopus ATCC 62051]